MLVKFILFCSELSVVFNTMFWLLSEEKRKGKEEKKIHLVCLNIGRKEE